MACRPAPGTAGRAYRAQLVAMAWCTAIEPPDPAPEHALAQWLRVESIRLQKWMNGVGGPARLEHTHATLGEGRYAINAVGHFGFSVVGAVFLLGLFVPNLLWSRTARPAGYDPAGEPVTLRILERAGQALTTTAALIFRDTNLHPWSPWSWWFVAAATLMVAYEVCWVRYFTSERTLNDFYRSRFGVPVPLATLPVAAFLLLGAYGRILPLIVAVAVLGVGHIGIHLQHRRALLARAATTG